MDLTKELSEKSYDEMSEDELRWLKDHNRLPLDVEREMFTAKPGIGGTSEGEYLGDENTRNTVAGSGLHPEEDLSGIDRAEQAEAEVEALRQQLAEAEAQRDAALAGAAEEESEEDEGEDYSAWTVAELQAEIDERNADREEKLPRPSKKGELIAVLETDDEYEPEDE
jgi:hypothetical protein